VLRRVKQYIDTNHLLTPGSRVLVCVSGGADSVALFDILLRAGYACVVAHCNFHLRGEESDRDTFFVRALVKDLGDRLKIKPEWIQNGIPYYEQHFDTKAYAQEHGLSIEAAARELRYTWFEQIAKETGCEAIAVAHHQNDQAETVLMHIRRGCGLNGLCGMRAKSKNPFGELPLVRPLLCTTHEYICYYLKEIRKIDWVEDSTNSDTTYRRNAIREELKSWSKAEIEHICQLAERVQQVELISPADYADCAEKEKH